MSATTRQNSTDSFFHRASNASFWEGVLFPPNGWWVVVLGCFGARSGRRVSEARLLSPTMEARCNQAGAGGRAGVLLAVVDLHVQIARSRRRGRVARDAKSAQQARRLGWDDQRRTRRRGDGVDGIGDDVGEESPWQATTLRRPLAKTRLCVYFPIRWLWHGACSRNETWSIRRLVAKEV